MRADASKVRSDLNRAKAPAMRAVRGLAGAMSGAMGSLGIATGVAAIGMVFIKAATAAATFEEAMVRVRANARLLGKEGEASYLTIEKAVRQLGATTRYTSVQAAEAMNQLVLGGLNAKDAIGALPTVLNLAASAGFELGDAAKVVVDNMVKFKLAASDTGRIADFLSSAQSRAQTTAQELAVALTALGSSAADLGISFRDTTALLTALAKAGVRGGEAGTAMAIALQRLISQPKDAAEALQELGINIRDFATGPGGALDAIGLFRALADAMPTDAVSRSEKAFALFGARGRRIVGLLSLMQRGKFVENLAKGLESDLGRAARVAAARMDTFIGTLKELISAMSELAIAALTPVLNAVEPLIDIFRGLSLVISKSVEVIRDVDKKMGGFIGNTIKATMAVIGLRFAIKALGPAARVAARAIQLATVSTGFGILIVAIGVVVASIIALINWLRKTVPVVKALKESADLISLAWENIKQTFDIMMGAVIQGWLGLLNLLGITNIDIAAIGDTFSEMAATAIKAVSEFALEASEWILAIAQNWKKVGAALPDILKAALSYAFDIFVNYVGFMIDAAWAMIKGMGRAFMSIPEMLEAALTGGDVGAILLKNLEKTLSDLPNVIDIGVASDRTKKLMKTASIDDAIKSVVESKVKLEAGRADKLEKIKKKKKEGEKPEPEPEPGAPPEAASALEEIGFKGLRERGRSIQENLLKGLVGDKKDKVQEDQLAVAEASKKIQEDMLKSLTDQNAGGLVAGNK